MIDPSLLDDATAERILKTIARLNSPDLPEDLHDLRDALASNFQIVPCDTNISPGDLARLALMVLAEDSKILLIIDSIATHEKSSASRHTYDGATTMALGIAAYFALSTAVEIERDKRGKWSFKMKVRPAGEGAVRKLIEKLVGYLPG